MLSPTGPAKSREAGEAEPAVGGAMPHGDLPQPPVRPDPPRRHHGDNTVVENGTTYTGYPAGPGWDPATGLGSPNAAVLIPMLSHRPTA